MTLQGMLPFHCSISLMRQAEEWLESQQSCGMEVKMTDKRNRCPGCKRDGCNGCGIFQKLNTNKNVRVSFPEDFQPETEEGLGISFDVGTTSLAGMLWDLSSGTLLNVETGANPQAVFGADVVRRIQAAENRENLVKMQKLLIDRLDGMAEQLVLSVKEEQQSDIVKAEQQSGAVKAEQQSGAVKAEQQSGAVKAEQQSGIVKAGKPAAGWQIRRVTLAGNTAMCEILMGIEPAGLFNAPFRPDYTSTVLLEGSSLGFQFLQDARIIILPPVGGYVGADALMVYSYVKRKEPGKKILAVDIGTNGEILLLCNDSRYACSAAAGPALEGGAVSQGMRAVQGAIDMVSLSGRFPVQDIAVRVIGEAVPAGICGSGLVDALALLYRIGVLDHTGYMRSALEAKKAGVPERICRRIIEGSPNAEGGQNEGNSKNAEGSPNAEGGQNEGNSKNTEDSPNAEGSQNTGSSREDGERRFLLTGAAHPVFLTAGDVRQLQLAVSAIRSGMEILLRKAGCKAEELDGIYLAGAFGCCIRAESGIQIGLFPNVPGEKLIQAGNLAGTGAAMALLSPGARRRMEEEKNQITHVELAGESDFQELFLSHMNFPLQF